MPIMQSATIPYSISDGGPVPNSVVVARPTGFAILSPYPLPILKMYLIQ